MLETILVTKCFVSVPDIAVYRSVVLRGWLVWYRVNPVELSKKKVIYLADANYALPQRTTGLLCCKERMVPNGVIRK